MGRCPMIGTLPSSASATARSEARTPLHAIRYDLAAGVWFRRYGLPSETRTVGRAASVAVMSCASESGRTMLPRDEIGRTFATNTVVGARAITVRAESYDSGPDIGHSRKYATVSPPWRNSSAMN